MRKIKKLSFTVVSMLLVSTILPTVSMADAKKGH